MNNDDTKEGISNLISQELHSKDKILKPDFNQKTGRELLAFYLQTKFKQILAFDKKTQKYVGYEVCTINDIRSIDTCLHDEFYVGESVDIIWSYYPSEVIDDFVITSTDSTVAKVSEDGKIYIKGIGNAVVTITSSNGESTTKEIVVNEPLTISVTADNPSSPLIGEKRVFNVYFTDSRETYCDISVVSPSLKVLDIKHDKDGSINRYYITTECIDTNFSFAIFSISDENGEIARYVRPI